MFRIKLHHMAMLYGCLDPLRATYLAIGWVCLVEQHATEVHSSIVLPEVRCRHSHRACDKVECIMYLLVGHHPAHTGVSGTQPHQPMLKRWGLPPIIQRTTTHSFATHYKDTVSTN